MSFFNFNCDIICQNAVPQKKLFQTDKLKNTRVLQLFQAK